MLLAVVVTAANVDDARGAEMLFAQTRAIDFPRLAAVFADGKYHNHDLYAWLHANPRPFFLEVVSRPEGERRFVPLKIRWVVERTFAWEQRYRGLAADREHTAASSEAFVRAAAVHHMLHRLSPEVPTRAQRFRFEGHTRKAA